MNISAVFARNLRSGLLVAAAAGSIATSSTAFAQQATSAVTVDAAVTANCVVSTTPVSFGNVDVTSGSAVLGTGGVSVTCTNGTAWSAAADAGQAVGATPATRQMTDGTNLLNYSLYTDTGRTTLWGDGTAASAAITDTGTGAAQPQTIFARVPAGQNALPAGNYADLVVVTVTY
ncbi:MAG: hypothetical protein JWN66_4342 [Sphingomonas bacterium]|jgi:spore coat protein U-like protein|uniref:Csu type fimbrial protein n=1 Tax=Sphingomonas bacterium TaxID=1895847 RepID=UPI00260AEB28|nr:spore coat U domain-containing protein [Sphingomonas bacterium]MDB5707226.1 hypothetical protein [Sphingomonas bacterium]